MQPRAIFHSVVLTLVCFSCIDAKEFTIVTLGDSITRGVRKGVTREQTFAFLLEQGLRKNRISSRVINVGIGGERTDQSLRRLRAIVALQPDVVTVMYGTNDSYVDQGKKASRISLKAYRSNLRKIVANLLRRGIQVVLMTEPRWSDDAKNGLGENPNVRLEPYLAACRMTAREWRVPLVDHYAIWTAARKKGVNLRKWTTDGCHPDPGGHRQLAKAILPVVSQLASSGLRSPAKLLAGATYRVVCFGDSVTGVYYHTGSRRAYTDMLGIALRRIAARAKVQMINAGISGHTTADALARIERDVLRHRPDLVTVMFGLNDMVRVPLVKYRANLREIIRRCRAAGAEVVLATPNNVISTSGRPTDKLIRYCDVVRSVGRELKVPVSDCYREFDAERAIRPFVWRLWMSDQIHPNMDGHKRIATALAQTITGQRVSLDNVRPSRPTIVRTMAQLRANKPVRVIAMPPFDKLIGPALKKLSPRAKIAVETWKVEGRTMSEIERDAKARIRRAKPDLVIIAVPRNAQAASHEAFSNSYTWTMNWSLNFGPPTCDCIVVHPSVAKPLTQVPQ